MSKHKVSEIKFQSPTKRVNTSKRCYKKFVPKHRNHRFQSPTKRVNTSKLLLLIAAGWWLYQVSIPYKAGQHFKNVVFLRGWSNRVIVSIPYKAGQHFKIIDRARQVVKKRAHVSIPYKAGQHFKTG